MAFQQAETVEDLLLNDSFCAWVQSGKVENKEIWEKHLQAYPEKLALVEEATLLIQQLSFRDQNVSEEEIEILLQDTLRQLPNVKKELKAKNSHLFKRLAVAAVVLVLITISCLLNNYLSNDYQVYQTAYGEKKEIRLPDQSIVTLQSNSTLKIPKEWERTVDREIWMSGEAFFEVKKSPERQQKFFVHSNDFDIEVLGTAFNVLSREHTKRVVLQEGKIKLNTPDQSLELVPNEMLAYSPEKKTFIKTVVNALVHSSWTENAFYLEQISLNEIARILEENYGYIVEIAQGTKSQQISSIGTVKIENLNQLLLLLEEAYNVEVIKKGNRIFLK